MLNYFYLGAAIVAEVIGTMALKSSEGFTRLTPSLITALGYATAFYFLSLTLRALPVGIVYATWSGVGIVLISALGWVLFKQTLDLAAILGLALVVAGLLVMNLLSKSVPH
jgi:small multidrug resistance pump